MIDPTDRRQFIRATAASLAWMGLGQQVLAQQEESSSGVPTRPLGRTGERVSIICLGGFHIGAIPEPDAIKLMHAAIDEGVTFFDNAWDYHMGGSEEVMGKALEDPTRRDKVFLMTKNCERDREGSLKNLEDSLRRLRTDRIDLWQFHEINYDNDPDWIFERGAIGAAIDAQRQGKVRYIGFTGHKMPAIHLKMLDMPYEWDTVQMPINLMDAQYRSFQNEVLPVCVQRGIGAIGMKALGGGNPQADMIKASGVDAPTLRRFALTQPISSLVCGMTSLENLQQDVKVAREFQPMPADEIEKLLQKTKLLAGDGRLELFKSTQTFDGMYHRKQHELALEEG